MTVALVMIVKDEQDRIERCLRSTRGLIDSWAIVDTGSTDRTRELVRTTLRDVPGKLYRRKWRNFGANLTDALALAQGTADWVLRLDADMTVKAHVGLRDWLATDPDPDTDAWQVEIMDGGTLYRLPLLTRGTLGWRYVGPTHEYLDPAGRKQRPLLGLTVTHHADGRSRDGKFERDIALLADGVAGGDTRSVFYTAESLRFLGRTDEAIAMYERRAGMGGFEEEAWYAAYMAARLRQDPGALIDAYRRRPWRHEPITRLAQMIAATPNDDILFREAV